VPMTLDLTAKVAVVTGSSRGIGRAIALALAKAGADVAITSRTVDSLTEVESEIASAGRKSLSVRLDVREQDSIRAMADHCLQYFGRVDILVNNAGMNIRTPALVHFDGPYPGLAREMDWVRKHPDVTAYNLYETANFSRFNKDGRFEGSPDMAELVRHHWREGVDKGESST